MTFFVPTAIIGLGMLLDFAGYWWIPPILYLSAFAILALLLRAGKGPQYINAEFEEVRAEIVKLKVIHDDTKSEIADLRGRHEKTKAGVEQLSEEYRTAETKIARLELEKSRLITELERERQKIKLYREMLENR